jgi:lipopolysaccharide export system protein LptA
MKLPLPILFALLIGSITGQAQTPASDSLSPVEILPGVRKLEFRKLPDGTELQILAGNVKLRQGTTYFYTDSCVVNSTSRVFEAFGRVHINDSDTTHIYANHLRYLIDPRYAYLDGSVRLTDGHGTLTTNALEYDVANSIGTYSSGGKVVRGKSVLTSQEGVYYSDVKDIYFRNNVELKDPAYYLKTDSMIYNTETEVARFIAETFMIDSSNRTIRTTEGYYDLKTRHAEFTQRTTIEDRGVLIVGDEIASDDSTGIVQIRGNGVLIDSAQGVSILANEIFANKKTEAYLATKKPLMIIRQENDSIYVTADTLFTARLSDLFRSADTAIARTIDTALAIATDTTLATAPDTALAPVRDTTLTTIPDTVRTAVPDTVITRAVDTTRLGPSVTDTLQRQRPLPDTLQIRPPLSDTAQTAPPVPPAAGTGAKKDSTDRYFEAYHNVRIYSDSVQAVSDSLFYSFKDSIFRLFDNPVVWSRGSQITGDTIFLYTRNKKADRFRVWDNSFLVNEVEPSVYNQVKASRMDGFFKAGTIDSVRARGFAESIYFIRDEDSAYTGINQTKSDVLDVYFREGKLNKVVFRSAVKGTVWPISQKRPGEMLLPGFNWLEARRPKTKYELME